jgi:oligo-1,6-glucosidase
MDAVFYQIYPRSFQDSNGDGIGDIQGIISRLDAVAALGVTALWLSPLYPSPDADNGYDIADYCDIDPRYGTLADFDRLVAEAGRRGIRIVMDLVINHTSSQHPWFRASRRRVAPYDDYYIWRPGRTAGSAGDTEASGTSAPDGERIPPNNWTGFFMGPAWEWDEERQEFYLHLFDKRQPDLNYHNRAVIEEIKQILRFWLDRGVAGFRCDVISLLYKTSLDDGETGPIRGLEHYKAQPGTHAILAELRRDVLQPYHAFTIGEAVMVTPQEARDLTAPERHELDMVFYFDHLEVDRVIAKYVPKPFSAAELLNRLTRWQQSELWNAAYWENHDQPRIVSHYGNDKRYWKRSAMALALIQLTLRGTPFIYQGQEIGMTNFDVTRIDQLDDVESRNMDTLLQRYHVPQALRWYLIRTASRDNARTPMQWDSGPNGGFTTGTPWLGVNSNASWLNYAKQTDDPRSVLNFYRRLIRLRATSPTLREGGFEPIWADRHVMAYRRTPAVVGGPAVQTNAEAAKDGSPNPPATYTVWVNLSDQPQRLKRPWLLSAIVAHPTITTTGVRPPMIVASNTGRHELNGILEPWEAVLVREVEARPWHGDEVSVDEDPS